MSDEVVGIHVAVEISVAVFLLGNQSDQAAIRQDLTPPAGTSLPSILLPPSVGDGGVDIAAIRAPDD